MDVRCFYETVESNYRCCVEDHRIPENVELKFIGNHKEGKTDNDVTHIYFDYCNITKVPQGLTRKFPNLEILQIFGSGGNLKNISKKDLMEYKNLKEINICATNIEFLPGDLFEGFENLESINFDYNGLKTVEPNILDGLVSLNKVNFGGFLKEIQVDVETFTLNSNNILSLINSALFDKFMKSEVSYLKNFVTKLLTRSKTVKELNTNLTFENDKISQKCQELEQEVQNFKDNEEALNHEIQDLKAQTNQNQQKYLELSQKYSDLEQQFAAGILNEQQDVQKFCSDIKNFIQDETTKDFQIQIEGQEFPVHKFLLAARSPTLAEILKNNPEVENLNLIDISVEIFEIILKFLYTDELPGEDETNFLHLFAAAGKLKIEELMNFAASKLIDMIHAENALEIFKLANKYEQQGLKLKAFEEIKSNYPKSKFKDEWIDNTEKVEKLIEILKKMEEVEKCLNNLE